MPANTLRYLVENDGAGRDAVKAALKKAVSLCIEHRLSRITIVAPAKQNVDNSALAEIIGADAVKALGQGKALPAGSGVTIGLESIKTFSPHGAYEVVLGLYLSSKGMDAIDGAAAVKAIVMVPWNAEEGKAWLATWAPEIIGQRTWPQPQLEVDPGVEGALKVLSATINRSTGLAHPSDRERAKKTLAGLKSAGHRPRPADLRSWAVRNGWTLEGANALAELAKKHFA